MIEAPVQESRTDSPKVAAAVPAATPPSFWRRVSGWIPVKARLAVLTGSLVLVAVLLYNVFAAGSATLQVVCRHGFRNADVSVRVDGDVAFTEHISGAARKRLGLFEQVEGNFSKS